MLYQCMNRIVQSGALAPFHSHPGTSENTVENGAYDWQPVLVVDMVRSAGCSGAMRADRLRSLDAMQPLNYCRR